MSAWTGSRGTQCPYCNKSVVSERDGADGAIEYVCELCGGNWVRSPAKAAIKQALPAGTIAITFNADAPDWDDIERQFEDGRRQLGEAQCLTR